MKKIIEKVEKETLGKLPPSYGPAKDFRKCEICFYINKETEKDDLYWCEKWDVLVHKDYWCKSFRSFMRG